MSRKYILADYDYLGGFDSNGFEKKVYNKEAVENALKMWIVSLQGDVVRRIGYGGYIHRLLFKGMSDEIIDDLEFALRNGFQENFTPFVKLENLTITPDYAQRLFIIDIEAYIPEYNFDLRFSGALRAQ